MKDKYGYGVYENFESLKNMMDFSALISDCSLKEFLKNNDSYVDEILKIIRDSFPGNEKTIVPPGYESLVSKNQIVFRYTMAFSAVSNIFLTRDHFEEISLDGLHRVLLKLTVVKCLAIQFGEQSLLNEGENPEGWPHFYLIKQAFKIPGFLEYIQEVRPHLVLCFSAIYSVYMHDKELEMAFGIYSSNDLEKIKLAHLHSSAANDWLYDAQFSLDNANDICWHENSGLIADRVRKELDVETKKAHSEKSAKGGKKRKYEPQYNHCKKVYQNDYLKKIWKSRSQLVNHIENKILKFETDYLDSISEKGKRKFTKMTEDRRKKTIDEWVQIFEKEIGGFKK